MKAFIDWVLERRYRLGILAVATAVAPFMQTVSMALIALEALRRGPAQAAVTAGLGLAATLVVASTLTSDFATAGTLLGLTFGVGWLLGVLLRWAGGLTLAFQAVVLLSVLGMIAISVIGPGPETLFAPLLDELVGQLRERGATDAQIELFRATQPVMFGVFGAGLLIHFVAALFLAYWWRGLGQGDNRFGTEFRDLRLSRVLGFPASVLVTADLVLDVPLVQNLTPLALFGFLFQGLAVLHAWAHARHWHVGLIVPVYALLVTPLIPFVVLGLSAVGLMDNWFDLRAPLRSRT